MTPEEIDNMLNGLAQARERNAFQLGDGIRRDPIVKSAWVPGLPNEYTVHVWDDEFFTTVILVSEDTPVESIKGIFLQLKEANWKKES